MNRYLPLLILFAGLENQAFAKNKECLSYLNKLLPGTIGKKFEITDQQKVIPLSGAKVELDESNGERSYTVTYKNDEGRQIETYVTFGKEGLSSVITRDATWGNAAIRNKGKISYPEDLMVGADVNFEQVNGKCVPLSTYKIFSDPEDLSRGKASMSFYLNHDMLECAAISKFASKHRSKLGQCAELLQDSGELYRKISKYHNDQMAHSKATNGFFKDPIYAPGMIAAENFNPIIKIFDRSAVCSEGGVGKLLEDPELVDHYNAKFEEHFSQASTPKTPSSAARQK